MKMKNIKTLAIVTGIGLAFTGVALGQEKSDNGLNPLSLRPVHNSNVDKKVTLWRRVDLREKQNQPLFAYDTEITKHLIEGVKSGILDAYSDETLKERLTLDQFNERMFRRFEGGGLSQAEIDAGFGSETEDDGWGNAGGNNKSTSDDGWGDGGNTSSVNNSGSSRNGTPNAGSQQSDGEGYYMFPQDFYILEIKEDWLFDRQRSRQYFDIQSITIKIPAENSTDGLEKNLATFKYIDLVQFFKNNPNAVWFNEANTAKNVNLADAFELRLFSGRIVKTSNSQNKYLDELYGSPEKALIKSQEIEYELLEWEHNLWEY
jgi:hypothetical protein